MTNTQYTTPLPNDLTDARIIVCGSWMIPSYGRSTFGVWCA